MASEAGIDAKERLEAFRGATRQRYLETLPLLEQASAAVEATLLARLRDAAKTHGLETHPTVRTRVKPLDSAMQRLEELAALDLLDLRDLIGARVVVLDRADVTKVVAALDDLVPSAFHEYSYGTGGGRTRGFSGHWLDGIALERFVPRAALAGHDGQADLEGLLGSTQIEIQVQTVLQEAWLNVSHKDYYKSGVGAPAQSLDRLRRLAPVLDLIDGEISSLQATTREIRRSVQEDLVTAVSNRQLGSVLVDELNLKAFAQIRPETFAGLRKLGRESGMQHSGWDENVRVGDETDVCLAVCEATSVQTLGRFSELSKQYVDKAGLYGPKLAALVRRIADDGIDVPFDRPLLVFSLLTLMTSPYTPDVPVMSRPLWVTAARWKERDAHETE